VAASFDGGDTFTSSLPVSSQPNVYGKETVWPISSGGRIDSAGGKATISLNYDLFLENGGHTTGLVADAAGVFHPFWVDNRTSVSQIWSAPITIPGSAIKNGVADLAALDNISRQIAIDIEGLSFDRTTNTAKGMLRLKNVSKDTIRGPVKVRALRVTSGIGNPEIVGADNGVYGTGAIWDLSPTIPAGGLLPDVLSSPREISFKISDIRPFRAGREWRGSVVSVETRVYGRSSAKRGESP
jgi:hypothetical protein